MELLGRYLPPPPAVILDVGGASGVYSCLLARQGYAMHLVDPVPLHIEQARAASQKQPNHPLVGVTLGDARHLEHAPASMDAVLLFGPLYHLTEREDRLIALAEAKRVLRLGGLVVGAAISRFASTFDGLFHGLFEEPAFAPISQRDLVDGQHRNPTENPAYWTTAYFHLPREIKTEVEEAGFRHEATIGVEGPGWLLQDFEHHWRDQRRRERLIGVARALESEPSLAGLSAHILVLARKPSATTECGSIEDKGRSVS